VKPGLQVRVAEISSQAFPAFSRNALICDLYRHLNGRRNSRHPCRKRMAHVVFFRMHLAAYMYA
jgi:hypothetical protein